MNKFAWNKIIIIFINVSMRVWCNENFSSFKNFLTKTRAKYCSFIYECTFQMFFVTSFSSIKSENRYVEVTPDKWHCFWWHSTVSSFAKKPTLVRYLCPIKSLKLSHTTFSHVLITFIYLYIVSITFVSSSF